MPQENEAQMIPEHAHERLKQRGLFTSDLSVNEFLLVKQAGFDPVRMVVGSSIYHIGYQSSRWSKNEEMKVLTHAMYHARELAMSRMEEEAREAGADGVVGVRLTVKHMPDQPHIAEFVAVGTAVYARDRNVKWTTNKDLPFTSDLSGQDFWTLLQMGYRPTGLVMGNCVYHVAHRRLGAWLSSVGQNQELVLPTQAIYDARELAMERMEVEAKELGSEGVVGMDLHERTYNWNPNVIEFFAVGTAVVPFKENHIIEKPALTMNVND